MKKVKLPVLCYHKVGVPPAGPVLSDLWVSAENFGEQVKWLADNGFTTLHFRDLFRIHRGEAEMPEKPVLITFDDGYKNNCTAAYPVLKALGAKGNIFLVYNTIGKENVWHNPASEARIPMATLEELKAVRDGGVFDFGAHTMNHPHLCSLDFETAVKEINDSKKNLEKAFGYEFCAFAYPYGDGAYDSGMRSAVMKAGFTFDFSFRHGVSYFPWDGKNTIDRLFVKGGDSIRVFQSYFR